MNSTPQGCPSLFTALDWYRNSTLIRTTTEQLHSLMSQYLPSVVFAVASKLPEDSVGLVCQGLKCLPAASSLEQMLQQVRQSQVRG